jgi:hypothetical protein
MATARWYTPQLSRAIVAKLYFKARSERVPMTVLANRLMERALAEGATRPSATELVNEQPKTQ